MLTEHNVLEGTFTKQSSSLHLNSKKIAEIRKLGADEAAWCNKLENLRKEFYLKYSKFSNAKNDLKELQSLDERTGDPLNIKQGGRWNERVIDEMEQRKKSWLDR